MNLDQYLARFVEGYLFEDLRAMSALKANESTGYGGVGYPMVLCTLAGIELLGILTSEKEFNPMKGSERFQEFWRGYLYPKDVERQKISLAIYKLVRHGLAHTFLTKPSFIVVKAHDGGHMSWINDQFFIDALTFSDELVTAYEQRVKPRMSEAPFRARMETRFTEFRDRYRGDYTEWEPVLRQGRVLHGPTSSGPVLAPHSPSLNHAYSTNVTAPPPDE